MRWLLTAFVWMIAIGAGIYGSKYYRQWMSDYRAGIVKAHAKAWDDAIGTQPDKLGTEPDKLDASLANTNKLVGGELLGPQHMALHTQLSKVDHDKAAEYYRKQWQFVLADVAVKKRPNPEPLIALAVPTAQGDVEQALKDVDQEMQEKYAAAVKDYYKKQWKIVLDDVANKNRPDPDPLIALASPRSQAVIEKAVKEVDESQQDEYASALAGQFTTEWEAAYRTFDDTPVPEKFAAAHIKNPRILKESGQVLTRLERTDKELYQGHARRVGLAIDSFSGYGVFRSPEFRAKLIEKNKKLPPENRVVLHLIDDEAKYKKRIQTLKEWAKEDGTPKEGGTPLAVFTIDALVMNSAIYDSPPGKIILLLDESHGADAIIGFKSTFPNAAAMDKENLKIIGVGDSPSETLARVAKKNLKLDKVRNDSYLRFETPEKVIEQLEKADPKEPKVFALWEPYVSQLINKYKDPDKKLQRLTDSGQFSGAIVDVLVADEKWLEKHKAEATAVVEAYLETLPSQKTTRDMANLVQKDAEGLKGRGKTDLLLSSDDAEEVAKRIWWKTVRENYGHFGLLEDAKPGDYESVLNMIKESRAVLIQAGILDEAKAMSKQMDPEKFVDASICKALKGKEGFQPKDLDWNRVPTDNTVEEWKDANGVVHKVKPVPVSKPDFEPIEFESGNTDLPTDDDTMAVMKKAVQMLKDNKDYYLKIWGHPASDAPLNVETAMKRSQAVEKWLNEQGGIPKDRLKADTLDPQRSLKTATGKPKPVVTLEVLQPVR